MTSSTVTQLIVTAVGVPTGLVLARHYGRRYYGQHIRPLLDVAAIAFDRGGEHG